MDRVLLRGFDEPIDIYTVDIDLKMSLPTTNAHNIFLNTYDDHQADSFVSSF